jgi:DNA modification methylase
MVFRRIEGVMVDTIICGDCLDMMAGMEDASIDLIVTDPPYGMSFMGKAWDKALPSVDVWRECLRVLKPGAFAFVMCIPRQDCLSRMIINLEDAGFMVNFSTIYWTYATGFPKAANLSKLADKRYKKRSDYDNLAVYIKAARAKKGVSQKKIAELFPSKTGGLTGCVWNWENGANVPTTEQWLILKDVLDLDERFDYLIEQETKRYEEAEREVVGQESRQGRPPQPMWGEDDGQAWDQTLSATPEAKALDGAYAGYQPKPAVEVVIVAMKPLAEKTYLDQALANGKGCTWLDDGRIPFTGNENSIRPFGSAGDNMQQMKNMPRGTLSGSEKGRFAPNLLVSDDVLNSGKNHVGGYRKNTSTKRDQHQNTCYGKYQDTYIVGERGYNDSGSFSRYFSLDAWAEKNLPESVNRTFPFLIVPKASKSEKNAGLDGLDDRTEGHIASPTGGGGGWKGDAEKNPNLPRKNHHPTCKPIKLMSYLIAIGSRTGDVVLDPYAGSGTTGIAAALLDRRYMLIEMDAEYCRIARERIRIERSQLKLGLGR